LDDLIDYACGIIEEAVVGNAQHPVASGAQIYVSVLIMGCLRRFLMHIPIELYDEANVVAAEICHESRDGKLTPELEPTEPAVAEQYP